MHFSFDLDFKSRTRIGCWTEEKLKKNGTTSFHLQGKKKPGGPNQLLRAKQDQDFLARCKIHCTEDSEGEIHGGCPDVPKEAKRIKSRV